MRSATTAKGLHPLYGSRQSVVLARLSAAPAQARVPGVEERHWQLLLRLFSIDVLQDDPGRADLAQVVANEAGSRSGHLPVQQWLLQSAPMALSIELE